MATFVMTITITAQNREIADELRDEIVGVVEDNLESSTISVLVDCSALMEKTMPTLIGQALHDILVEVDAEIEQRKSGGNDEDWQSLQALSNAGHAALRAAGN